MPPPPGYGGAGYAVAAPRTEPLAIWSLVLGVVSIVCCGLVAGIPAIILGFMARGRIASGGGALTGAGMAMAGIVLGFISIGITVVGLILYFTIGMAAMTHPGV